MFKKFSFALVLLMMAASANAVLLDGNSLKTKNMVSKLNYEPSKAVTVAHSPTSITPLSSQNNQSSLIDPQQYFVVFSGQSFVVFSGQSKAFLSQTANSADNKKLLNGAEVSAVPVPAALPLVATVLVIYGIARRRKTFK